ncbi:MAG: RnfABCDGE type electron transport complex subunit D, partial [Clostridia bacterium]|nr:RnfABCDGE type electron transport complex subunit D [Clostridia bacterium]
FTVSLSPHVRSSLSTQKVMLLVLLALLPACVMGVVYFGFYALLLMVLSVASAVGAEYVTCRIMKRENPIKDCSAAVTGLLIALSLPPKAPWWLPVIGSVFAIVIVKQLFGGLGSNFVNPALAARAFLMASWPVHMTSFITPFDAVASATPLSGTLEVKTMDLLLGNIPGTVGEICKIAVLAGGLFLLFSRVITWHIPVSFLGSLALFTVIAGGNPLTALLSGGVLFVAFFMATDYVTSPVTPLGRIIFGFGCGLITFAIRTWGAYPDGITYAVLFMNVASPLIERFTKPKIYGEVKKNA